MRIVRCVNCGNDIELDIAKAADEDGEVFICQHCGYKFRYCDK